MNLNLFGTKGNVSLPLRVEKYTESILFLCLSICVLSVPHSTKLAVNCFRIAMILWITLAALRPLPTFRLTIPVLTFLVAMTLSTLFSFEPLLSWGRLRTVSLLALMPLVATTIREAWKVRWLVLLLVLSCVASAGYTGWQYLGGIGVQIMVPEGSPAEQNDLISGDIITRLNGRRIHNPKEWFQFVNKSNKSLIVIELLRASPGIPPQLVHKQLPLAALAKSGLTAPGPQVVLARPSRAHGAFQHYYPYAEILVTAGLLTWGLAISAFRANRFAPTYFLLVSFIGLTAALFATLSRVALVVLILGCGLLLLSGQKHGRRWANAAIILVASILIMLYVSFLRGQTHIMNDPGTQYRLLMWRDSWTIIRQHPLLGTGLDAVAGNWQRWPLAAFSHFPLRSHFHSTPIQLAVETGFLGLAAWIFLVVALGRTLWKEVKNNRAIKDWFSHGLLQGVFASYGAFLVIGLVQYNFGDAEFMILFWLVTGITLSPGVAPPHLEAERFSRGSTQ